VDRPGSVDTFGRHGHACVAVPRARPEAGDENRRHEEEMASRSPKIGHHFEHSDAKTRSASSAEIHVVSPLRQAAKGSPCSLWARIASRAAS